MRLQKYLAICGVSSRRTGEKLIAEGRVSVNGEIITQMGFLVEDGARVSVDGKEIQPEERKRYILYYKPFGEVCTMHDPEGRPTVAHRFKNAVAERIYPVGRLDYDSEGLLLLTNDGDFAYRVLHPKYEIKKTYLVRTDSELTREEMNALRNGVQLDGKTVRADTVRTVKESDDRPMLLITIHEGKNRQIRRMLEAVGHSVQYLCRVQLGPLRLEGVARSEWRELTEQELRQVETYVSSENKHPDKRR